MNKQLCDDLINLGIRSGDTVLVHSSLKSLGPVDGGAETVIQSLLEVLGENGTLLFPAFSFNSVGANNPVFDVKNTPSCVGALSEYFRTRPGTIRSIHPTHSMSGIGKKARLILSENHLDTTPCGEYSPFRKLRTEGDWILFIGCTIAPNTTMHAVEELAMPPYLLGDAVDYRIIHEDGTESIMSVRCHNFAATGYAQQYIRLGELLSQEELHCGKVLQAECYLMKISAVWEKGFAALQKNPFHFVEKD